MKQITDSFTNFIHTLLSIPNTARIYTDFVFKHINNPVTNIEDERVNTSQTIHGNALSALMPWYSNDMFIQQRSSIEMRKVIMTPFVDNSIYEPHFKVFFDSLDGFVSHEKLDELLIDLLHRTHLGPSFVGRLNLKSYAKIIKQFLDNDIFPGMLVEAPMWVLFEMIPFDTQLNDAIDNCEPNSVCNIWKKHGLDNAQIKVEYYHNLFVFLNGIRRIIIALELYHDELKQNINPYEIAYSVILSAVKTNGLPRGTEDNRYVIDWSKIGLKSDPSRPHKLNTCPFKDTIVYLPKTSNEERFVLENPDVFSNKYDTNSGAVRIKGCPFSNHPEFTSFGIGRERCAGETFVIDFIVYYINYIKTNDKRFSCNIGVYK
jgi:hypothetical protein